MEGKKNRCEKERCKCRDVDKGGERIVMEDKWGEMKRGEKAELEEGKSLEEWQGEQRRQPYSL